MSKAQSDANQRAFEKGQSDWRTGKDYHGDNPYPPGSSYHQYWQQGWEEENKIHHD